MGKVSKSIKNSMIVGSGSNYIVISVDNQAEANEINEADSKMNSMHLYKNCCIKIKKYLLFPKNIKQELFVNLKNE